MYPAPHQVHQAWGNQCPSSLGYTWQWYWCLCIFGVWDKQKSKLESNQRFTALIVMEDVFEAPYLSKSPPPFFFFWRKKGKKKYVSASSQKSTRTVNRPFAMSGKQTESLAASLSSLYSRFSAGGCSLQHEAAQVPVFSSAFFFLHVKILSIQQIIRGSLRSNLYKVSRWWAFRVPQLKEILT